jgi:hypothetical protein
VLSVYQVGGIRTPGISDVDLCVIFADGARCPADPLAGLEAHDRYLFPHAQFGLCRRHFALSRRYPFFHDFRLLWGDNWGEHPEVSPAAADERPNEREAQVVNVQTGLEYLLKMYASMTVEQTYGIARVRNQLLLGRALSYDLDYVGITSGRIVDLVRQIAEWRDAWFLKAPPRRAIIAWFREFHAVLGDALAGLFARHRLYVPAWADLRFAANMELVPAERFRCEHSGLALPAAFAGLGRRFFNFQHRFNHFRFHVPLDAGEGVDRGELQRRHELVSEMMEYNRLHLPHFMPVSTALNIFRRRGAG